MILNFYLGFFYFYVIYLCGTCVSEIQESEKDENLI